MRASGVYAILNLFDGKIYIGSAKYIKSRFGWHHRALENNKHHNILLKRAWDKYGEDSFIFFVIEVTDDLLVREQYWMDRFSSYHPDSGYNLYPVAGSPANVKLTEEHKRKIGEAVRGRKLSEETKANMSAAHLNRTAEHKANHAAAMKKRGITPEHKQKLKEANMKRGYKYVD
jgi:group I intron endonuclease